MVIPYDSIRKSIESLYEDKCGVIRRVSRKTESSPLTQVIPKIAYEELPCRLSKGGGKLRKGESLTHIEYDALLFAAPDADIRAGDEVIVTQQGEARRYTLAGEPDRFATHIQVALRREAVT